MSSYHCGYERIYPGRTTSWEPIKAPTAVCPIEFQLADIKGGSQEPLGYCISPSSLQYLPLDKRGPNCA